jgi:hypothetical protein
MVRVSEHVPNLQSFNNASSTSKVKYHKDIASPVLWTGNPHKEKNRPESIRNCALYDLHRQCS